MNDLLLKALLCEEVIRPPVWLMRQAGRYMPQYRELRKKHTLWELFHDSQLASEVTCQPLTFLGVDAAILFSDILIIAESLGLTVAFPDQGGPRVEPAIHTAAQVDALPYIPVEESLGVVFETIRLVKQRSSVPLIGFSGGPFTVASYFIDSVGHGEFKRTKAWMLEDPKSFHALLSKITLATIAYLKQQVKAGADALQVFDSWASVLDEEQFQTFCVPYLQQIVTALKETNVPVILFCRSSSLRAEALSEIRPSAISFDWHHSMADLRKKVPQGIAVQGNFNPEFLKLPQEEIAASVKAVLTEMAGARGYIVNLGHGVTPDIPFDNVRRFVDTVKEFSPLS
jgi:uroporphyrinogen decarboxylase